MSVDTKVESVAHALTVQVYIEDWSCGGCTVYSGIL